MDAITLGERSAVARTPVDSEMQFPMTDAVLRSRYSDAAGAHEQGTGQGHGTWASVLA